MSVIVAAYDSAPSTAGGRGAVDHELAAVGPTLRSGWAGTSDGKRRPAVAETSGDAQAEHACTEQR